MTVAEIKEFIIEKLNNKPILEIQNYGENQPQKLFVPLEHYGKILEEIKSMLDDLEPKAKWLETDLWEDGIGDIYKCSNCGSNHIDYMNYCSSCGARMNDELEENNK